MKNYPFTGPLDKEKDVKVDKKEIARVFNQEIVLGEFGTAKLRKGSKNGEILEQFSIGDKNVSVSGRELVLFPQKVLPYETEIFLTLDDGFVASKVSGEKCNFLNENSEVTFSFITEDPIGKKLDGGTIISKQSGRYLIVSPKQSEMNLFWNEREKAISHTEKITGTSGWFIPSMELFMNLEMINPDVWFEQQFDETNIFWTNSENGIDAYAIDMGGSILTSIYKNISNKVRTFKFVGV